MCENGRAMDIVCPSIMGITSTNFIVMLLHKGQQFIDCVFGIDTNTPYIRSVLL